MTLNAAVARRLGLPPQPGQEPQFIPAGAPPLVYPALSYAQGLDTGISPRIQRLPMLPRPVKKGIAGVPIP